MLKKTKLNKPFSRIYTYRSNQTSVLLEKRSQSHAKRKDIRRQAPVLPFVTKNKNNIFFQHHSHVLIQGAT